MSDKGRSKGRIVGHNVGLAEKGDGVCRECGMVSKQAKT